MKMKPQTMFLILLSMSISLASANAQQTATAVAPSETATDLPSAQQVIDRHLTACGLAGKADTIKTINYQGTMSIPAAGLTGKLELFQSADGKAAMTVNLPGIGDQRAGTDGTTVWELSQVTGADILTGEREAQMKLQFAVLPLTHYGDFFDSIECTAKEEFQGEPCYVVVAQKGKDHPVTTYFSVETGLEVGGRMTAITAMGDMEIVSTTGEYKDVDGIKMAHKSTAELPNGMTQDVTFESIRLNQPVPEGKFDLPEDVQELKEE